MDSYGYVQIATASPAVNIANPLANSKHIAELCHSAHRAGADIIVFPELSLTGYSCGDLFFQDRLLASARSALVDLAASTADLDGLLIFVGLPIEYKYNIYNVAAAVRNGQILALIPKTHLPNTREFYEKRWFSARPQYPYEMAFVELAGEEVQLGQTLIKLHTPGGDYTVGCEICEDLWAPRPVSTELALAGADIIVDLSASNDLIGKADYRRQLVRQQSARLNCAYAYCNAGPDESTSDTVFSGHSMIVENGVILAERQPFAMSSDELLMMPVDISLLRNERRQNSSFIFCNDGPISMVEIDATSAELYNSTEASADADHRPDHIDLRPVHPLPFIPSDPDERRRHCREVLDIQAHALSRRMRHIHCKHAVVGISGGLDSTLCLLATVECYRMNGWPMSDILGITMPGFGTTDRTHTNAVELMKALGITVKEIPIVSAVRQHFDDIGQDPNNHDITYENSQARERTQILMDVANQINGLVIGTGDLSELALGWCTYNGDQMSMYGLNGGIPKTLLRSIVSYIADLHRERANENGATIAALLDSILDTPISPELLPPDKDGNIVQQTEKTTGPYELHDFFLFYTLRYGFEPKKIFALARRAFSGNTVDPHAKTSFDPDTILHWMQNFYRRFFNQQFKRAALPDGPKIGSVALSPRGDWRMPSDADSRDWLAAIEELRAELEAES